MDIWQAIRQDREKGAQRLVSEFGDRLFSAAALLCRDDHHAEELVFRTFAQVVDKIHHYRPTGDFFSWVYTILLNFWRMDARRNRPDIVYMGTTVDLPPGEGRDAPEVIRDASNEDVQKALAALSAPLRDVVMMKYYREMPVEDIAAALDLPVGTVKSRLFNARKALYAMLKKERKERHDD